MKDHAMRSTMIVRALVFLMIAAAYVHPQRSKPAPPPPKPGPSLPKATSGFGAVLHKLPAGSFRMGSETGNADEKPVRTVKINSFFIATTETTYAQWIKVYEWARGKGYVFDGFEGIDTRTAFRGSLQCPVNKVSWFDCIKWCNAASEMDRRRPCYTAGGLIVKQGRPTNVTCAWNVNGYRLPTGAEWEYAARAVTASTFPWGFASADDHCWYENNSRGTTHPAGEKITNAWGLNDMCGNVSEWCWDAYQWGYHGIDTDNPKGPQCIAEYRVYRGGSYNYPIFNARPAYRSGLMPIYRLDYVGFRIASSL